MNVDPVMERYGPPVTLPLPPWLVVARGAVTTVADDLRRIGDDELARIWRRDEPHGEAEVRYVFYRALEAFERAAGLAERALADAGRDHVRDAVAEVTHEVAHVRRPGSVTAAGP